MSQHNDKMIVTKEWNKVIQYLYPDPDIKHKLQVSKEESSVWKISKNGTDRIVRLYSTHLVSKKRIDSERFLLNRLSQFKDYYGPRLLKEVFYFENIVGFEVSYIDGRHPRLNSTKDFFECGKAIARFHQFTNMINNEKLYQYNFHEILCKTKNTLFRTYLNSQQKKQLKIILNKISVSLKSLESKNELFGVLHGDPRWLNLIINGSNINLIDFGDCGYGLQIYDLAIGIADTVRNNPIYKIKIKDAMIAGYISILPNQKKTIDESLNDLISIRYIDTMASPVTNWGTLKREKYKNNIPRIINKCFILIENL